VNPDQMALLDRQVEELRANDLAISAKGNYSPAQALASAVLDLHDRTHSGPARWCEHYACQLAEDVQW
jgi:hypothetical protein